MADLHANYQTPKLTSTNYFNWRFKIEMLLKRENLWAAIVTDRPDVDFATWDKTDQKAHATIALCIGDDQIHHIRNKANAKQAWNALKEFYERDSPGVKVRLLREVMAKRAHDDTDMEAHVSQMNEIFQKLVAFGSSITWEFLLTATMLGSLPSSYDGLITAMEAHGEKSLTPSLVSAKIIEEFRRRQERDRVASTIEGADALRVTNFKRKSGSSITCFFCKKKGHVRSKCTEYSAWKANKVNKEQQQNKSKANVIEHDEYAEHLFFVGTRNSSDWIIDSGATCHIASKRDLFDMFDGSYRENVSVANGQMIAASGKGSIVLQLLNGNGSCNNVHIDNVLYVPQIGGNLISVKKLAEKGIKVTFYQNTCEIRSPEEKQIGFADAINNLYRLRVKNSVNSVTTDNNYCIHDWHRILGHRSMDAIRNIEKENIATGIKLAECRKSCKNLANCDVCIKGKLTRLPFPKESKYRSIENLQLIHSDLCGPMQTTTPSGKRYVLTFIDDFSRFTTIYLLKEKSETFQKFKEFYETTANKFGHKIKCLRSDRGGEYIDKNFVDYLNMKGVTIQRTAPYSPQQNGVAERKNRTLIEMTRCMLLDAGLENKFWGEAVMTANNLQNLLPWKSINGTPFEIWHGRKPFYGNLRRFGSKCFVRIQDYKRRKLDPKAEEAIFIGFDLQSKAYRCFLPEKGKVVVSRDVKFVNYINGTKFSNGNCDVHVDRDIFNNHNCDTDDDVVDDDAVDSNVVDVNQPSENAEPLRRSERPNKGIAPLRLIEEIDIVINGEPSNYNEAVKCDNGSHWIAAMEEEYRSLLENNTWKLVNLPDGKNLVGCKWVYKVKTDADGKINKYKARLVAQGFSQKYGVDYDQVFAPVAKHATFRILLSIAAIKKMDVYHFDAKTAFLNGELEEEIYMRQPTGFIDDKNPNKVCLLKRSIYGLKQSARVWNQTLHNVLIKANLKQSKADNCLYTLENSLFILIYVDDILIISSDKNYVNRIQNILNTNFHIDNLGLISNYLGIRVTKENNIYLIDQTKYILEVVKKFDLQNSKDSIIPISPTYHKQPEGEKLPTNEKYRAAIGCLLYISTNTRPDISAAVNILSQKVENPTQADWDEVKKLIRYLKGTSTLKLKLGEKSSTSELIGYADANWAEDRLTRKSNSGYIFLFNGVISWSCKRQDCVALSSTEAEFIALSEACKEAIWIQRVLKDLNWNRSQPTTIYEDNQSAIKLIADEKLSSRSKHIDTKTYFVKDYVEKKLVQVQFCPTEEMLADLFTKGLPKEKFIMFRNKLNLK